MSLQRVAFSPLHTFTRATNETFFNQVVDSFGNVSYQLQTAPSGTAVQNAYNPATGEPLGLQVFEQRTNLLTYSEQLNDASWSKANSGAATPPVVTANAGVAPDGTMTADRVQFSTGGSLVTDRSILRKLLTLTTVSHNLSLFIKSNTGAGEQSLAFNFKGSAVNVFTVTESEWTRVDMTGTALATISAYGIEANGLLTDSDVDVLVWGAQLEVGSFATPYIKTEATTATRNASVAVINDINTMPFWNASEGELRIKAGVINATNGALFNLTDGTNSNRVYVRRSDNAFQLIVFVGGVVQTATFGSYTDGENEIILRYGGGLPIRANYNGGVFAQVSSYSSLPPVNRLLLGTLSANDFTLNGHITKLIYYPSAGA